MKSLFEMLNETLSKMHFTMFDMLNVYRYQIHLSSLFQNDNNELMNDDYQISLVESFSTIFSINFFENVKFL